MFRRLALLLTLVVGAALPLLAWDYPKAPAGPEADVHAGVVVPDPFRWLEDAGSSRTRLWVAEQNKLSEGVLSDLPLREALRSRLAELWNQERVGLPQCAAGRYFYLHTNAPGRPVALYSRDSQEDAPRLLLDPGRVASENGGMPTTAVASPDGRWLLYSVASAGSDWSRISIQNLETLSDEPDRIEGVKFSSAAWTRDGAGFFYSRYPQAPAVSESARLFGALDDHRLYYHRVGTSQRSDVLIHTHKEDPRCFVRGRTTQDGRFLVVTVNRGTSVENLILCSDLGDPLRPDVSAPLRPLVTRWDSQFDFVGNVGQTLYFRTTWGAPRGCVMSVDFADGKFGSWRTIVPEGEDTLEGAGLIAGRLVVRLLHNATGRVRFYTPDGLPAGRLELPDNCTVTGMSGDWEGHELLFGYTDFVTAPCTMRHDFDTGQTSPLFLARAPASSEAYVTEQVECTSRDGTRFPMFVTRRRDIPLDGSAPAWLYGYGGFNVSMKPVFGPAMKLWLERGGIYAVPCLRGGGEFGEAWHQAGVREKRQAVIDDFVAAAEFLIAKGYTSERRLVASGESNGGMLVAAAANQRPELFRVVIPSVGVLDMLRYQKFTIGHAWAAEYGISDDPADFKFLAAYSPLHNIRPGARYPAILVVTGDSDDRVHPAHSYKYAAALQSTVSNRPGDLPVLLRVAERSGHGAGRTANGMLDEEADKLAFALHFIAAGE